MRQHHSPRIPGNGPPDTGIPGNGRAVAAPSCLPATDAFRPRRDHAPLSSSCHRHPGSGFHNGGGEALPG